jgi:hypothetical protein
MRIVEIQVDKIALLRLAVARRGHAVVLKASKATEKRVLAEEARPRVRLGMLAGVLRVPDDFDAPLPPDVLEDFER